MSSNLAANAARADFTPESFSFKAARAFCRARSFSSSAVMAALALSAARRFSSNRVRISCAACSNPARPLWAAWLDFSRVIKSSFSRWAEDSSIEILLETSIWRCTRRMRSLLARWACVSAWRKSCSNFWEEATFWLYSAWSGSNSLATVWSCSFKRVSAGPSSAIRLCPRWASAPLAANWLVSSAVKLSQFLIAPSNKPTWYLQAEIFSLKALASFCLWVKFKSSAAVCPSCAEMRLSKSDSCRTTGSNSPDRRAIVWSDSLMEQTEMAISLSFSSSR